MKGVKVLRVCGVSISAVGCFWEGVAVDWVGDKGTYGDGVVFVPVYWNGELDEVGTAGEDPVHGRFGIARISEEERAVYAPVYNDPSSAFPDEDLEDFAVVFEETGWVDHFVGVI